MAGRARRMSALEVATYGLLAAVALIFGYVEAVFPVPLPVPGIKLGLGNVVVLFALAGFDWRAGFAVAAVKVVVSAALFGNPSLLLYSAGGAVASFAAMWAALHTSRLSVVGVSMIGGVFHMLGQLAVVAWTFSPYVSLVYMPVLSACGLVTGALTGYVCRAVIRSAAKSRLFARRAKELARAGAGACAGGFSRNERPSGGGCGQGPAPALVEGTAVSCGIHADGAGRRRGHGEARSLQDAVDGGEGRGGYDERGV